MLYVYTLTAPDFAVTSGSEQTCCTSGSWSSTGQTSSGLPCKRLLVQYCPALVLHIHLEFVQVHRSTANFSDKTDHTHGLQDKALLLFRMAALMWRAGACNQAGCAPGTSHALASIQTSQR